MKKQHSKLHDELTRAAARRPSNANGADAEPHEGDGS